MATLAQLEKALVNADKAGDMDGARKLAVVIKTERARLGDTLMIPGTADEGDVPGTVPEKKPTPLSAVDALGPAEAGLSIGSSLVAPIIGGAAGVGKGLLDLVTGKPQFVNGEDQAAATADKVTNALTYEPRTNLGKDTVNTVGAIAEPLSQLDPMMAGNLSGVGEAAAAMRPVARAVVAERVISPIKQAVNLLTDKVKSQLPNFEPTPIKFSAPTEKSFNKALGVGDDLEGIVGNSSFSKNLRGGRAMAWKLSEDAPRVNNLTKALSEAKTTEPIELYRGLNDMDFVKDGLKVGSEFTDDAFTSAATSMNSAFITETVKDGGAVMKIHVPKGAQVAPVKAGGYYADEMEALIQRGAKFKIKSIEDINPHTKMVTVDLVGIDPRKDILATAAKDATDAQRNKLASMLDEHPSQDFSNATTPGTGKNAGAAAVDLADVRQAAANELPVPIKLTEGQKTRAFEQQRFERETAKQGEIGEPIRQRFQDQNLKLQQNMDAFIDSTGAELTESRGVGEIVDKALRQRAARDKTKIRSLYKEAEKAGEMEAKVPMDSVVQLLKDSSSAETLAPVLGATKKELERLGALNYTGRGDGLNLKLGDAENLRKFVTKVAGSDKTNLKYANEIKSAIDAATEGKGGDLYKQARAAYAQSMADYENFGLAKQLLKSKKGSTDRAVALEDVLRKSVISPSASVDSITKLKQLLQSEGPTGQQAWKELQGGMLRHVRDEALKGVGRDSAGNSIVSASALDKVVTQLDKTGKLDMVLGKKQAEQLRTVNEVAKDVLTSVPGAVNTSNTATVLAGLLDVAISGTAGVPVPVATVFKQVTSRIKDAKLRARVKQSLGE